MKILNLEDFITAQISERESERERVMHEHERERERKGKGKGKGEHERKRKKLDKRNFKNILTPPKRTSYKSTE